jgi:cytoplasmic tRNA 2-thiolation protein 1
MPSTCDTCGKDVFYHRAYSGESLCRSCFSESIEDKAKKSIAKYGMFRHGDFIGVAVSGGKDSLSLLRILSRITAGHGSKLVALTVDEGIEGYRAESLSYVAEVAERLGVPHLLFSYKELFGFTLDEALKERRTKLSSCAICGTFRRRAIDVAAMKAGVTVLATGHNLDDMVQTFMINLLSGDLKRIAWMNSSRDGNSGFRVRRVHPFLEIYEKEIALYAFGSGTPLQTIPCPYRDEGVRSEVRAYLNGMEEKHPGMKYALLKSALELSERPLAEQPLVTSCSRCGFHSTSDPCSVCTLLDAVKPVRV